MMMKCFGEEDPSTSFGQKKHGENQPFFLIGERGDKKTGGPIGLSGRITEQAETSNGHDKTHAHLTARGTTQPAAEAQRTHGPSPFIPVIPIGMM